MRVGVLDEKRHDKFDELSSRARVEMPCYSLSKLAPAASIWRFNGYAGHRTKSHGRLLSIILTSDVACSMYIHAPFLSHLRSNSSLQS